MDTNEFKKSYEKLIEAIKSGKVNISQEMPAFTEGPGLYQDGKRIGDIERVDMDMIKNKKLTIEKAIGIAGSAHLGQVDKGNAPYILHPLRVMLQMDTEEEMIIAVLHDVIEDTGWDYKMLMDEGASGKTIRVLGLLTRLRHSMPRSKNPMYIHETHREYIIRLAPHPMARRIKIADVKDNLNLNRLPIREIVTFASLIERETWALDYLQNVV